jgi:hypothetical protein
MSKYNNVNPDHYKVAGRERPGKGVAPKFKATTTEAEERERWAQRKNSEIGREKAATPPEAESDVPEESQEPEVESRKPEARNRK